MESGFGLTVEWVPWMSRKSARPQLSRMRQNVQSVGMGTGSLHSQKQAMNSYLRRLSNPSDAVTTVLNSQKSNSRYHRYKNKYCPFQSNAKTRTGNRHVSTVSAVNNGFVNVAGTRQGKYSSNYQVRNGQKLMEPFDGLPLCFIHPMTINFAYLQDSANLRTVTHELKERVQHCVSQFSSEAIIRGYFDIKMTYADGHQYVMPTDETTISYTYTRRDQEIVAMIHAHFIIFEPQMVGEEVRATFANEFPGRKRICLRKPHTEKVNANGEISHGIQGYAEYASLEKVELGFGKANGDALLKYIELDDTWDGRTKLIRYGNRTDKTMTAVNQDIYQTYLHALEEKRKAKHWDNIDYAKRFMYVWFNHTNNARDLYRALTKQSDKRHDDKLIGKIVQFLGSQSYDDLKDFTSKISDLLECVPFLASLLDSTHKQDQNGLQYGRCIGTYSNSSRCSPSGNTGNAGFLPSNYRYTAEQHYRLIPP